MRALRAYPYHALPLTSSRVVCRCAQLWTASAHPDMVEAALAKTLADLKTDYLDLYLV